jgi:hypothetical protein
MAMKMFVWSDRFSFLAVAQAESVESARDKMLKEIGEGGGDGSCPERDRARGIVKGNTPNIWLGANAEFTLTDAAESRESVIWELERLGKWVRNDPAVTELDDTRDNIARAIENRVRELRKNNA